MSEENKWVDIPEVGDDKWQFVRSYKKNEGYKLAPDTSGIFVKLPPRPPEPTREEYLESMIDFYGIAITEMQNELKEIRGEDD